MGKSGKQWQQDKAKYPDYSWPYWSGPWRQSSEEWGWHPQEPSAHFPSYDRMKGSGKMKGGKGSADYLGDDPESQLVKTVQENINAARKAEQRVRALIATRNQKIEMWRQYLDGMKKAYLKELQRHQRDVDKIDGDLEGALAVQEDARKSLRNVFREGIEGPREMRAGKEDGWRQMTEQWTHESEQAHDSEGVLHRALHSVGIDKDKLLAAAQKPLSPSQMPSYDASGFGLDARLLSPGKYRGLDLRTPTTTPTRSRPTAGRQRQAVKPPTVPRVKTESPGPRLGTKLEQAREGSQGRRGPGDEALWKVLEDRTAWPLTLGRAAGEDRHQRRRGDERGFPGCVTGRPGPFGLVEVEWAHASARLEPSSGLQWRQWSEAQSTCMSEPSLGNPEIVGPIRHMADLPRSVRSLQLFLGLSRCPYKFCSCLGYLPLELSVWSSSELSVDVCTVPLGCTIHVVTHASSRHLPSCAVSFPRSEHRCIMTVRYQPPFVLAPEHQWHSSQERHFCASALVLQVVAIHLQHAIAPLYGCIMPFEYKVSIPCTGAMPGLGDHLPLRCMQVGTPGGTVSYQPTRTFSQQGDRVMRPRQGHGLPVGAFQLLPCRIAPSCRGACRLRPRPPPTCRACDQHFRDIGF